jgi:hypothetical protein
VRHQKTPSAKKSAAGAEHEVEPSLPAWKAFVVQLSRDTRGPPGICAGRVQHLSTGRRARFNSEQELLASLWRLLADIEDPEG